MNITKQQLKQIIKEEIKKAMAEDALKTRYGPAEVRREEKRCAEMKPPKAWDPGKGCIPLEASKPKKPKKKTASHANPGSPVPPP